MKTPAVVLVLRWLLLSLVVASLGAWAVRTWTESAPRVGPLTDATLSGLPGTGLVVVNFHGTTRCRSCRTIGEQSRLAVEFGRRDGWLPASAEWQAIDFDQPSNRRYVSDYDLVSSTVVVLRREGGRVAKWERLDGVWDHSRDPVALSDYLRREITRIAEATGP